MMREDSRSLVAGRYRLGSVLGRGGVADVYEALDLMLGRTVAVKVFRHDDLIPHDRRRIDAEMRTLARLSHPGLVTLFDAGAAADVDGYDGPFLVMELVDGPTLGLFRAGQAVSPGVTARIGYELAEALAYIHDAGVVHRDVKPANVLMTYRADRDSARWTKLTDFGIARVIESDPLTEHGTAVGTAQYLSPEQATGAPTGPESDIYSLGLVLIECITGQMVFGGGSLASALARLQRDPVVPTHLGPGWHSIMIRMTARRPADRPSADEVARQFRALAATTQDTAILSTPLPPPEPPLVLSERPRRALLPWVSAGATAVVVAAALAWGLSGTDEEVGDAAVPVAESTSPTTTAPVETPMLAPVDELPAPVVEAPSTNETVYEAPVVAPPVVADEPPAPPRNNGNGNGNSGSNGNGNGNVGGNGNGNGNRNGR